MNSEAHTHEVEITRSDIYRNYRVKYGDTVGYVARWLPFLNYRMRRKVRVLTRRHDRGSIAAGRAINETVRLREVARIEAAKSAWPTETKGR